ncbi:hypothetical protein H072_1590 [Dactylellina haptotyla CBS 200.50]|uniref:lytic cellulose monooxygenase (C4-dehydrogenating) n=1 Tax=Dactylellina haptotyla (strain CBS 200.50) TaxID=1284197 RepID=S8ANB0_DACHA|nr:hypothetical protein H072_1590 [Dactylellina haptotyla CBS 200.50]
MSRRLFEMRLLSAVALLSAASTVMGHAYVKEFIIGGQSWPGFDPFVELNTQQGFVNQYWNVNRLRGKMTDTYITKKGSDEVICKPAAQPVPTVPRAQAGSQVTFRWSRWQFNHVGPIITYLAECPQSRCAQAIGARLNWFKIDQAGLSGRVWATDILQRQGKSYTIQLPTNIRNGQYLMRHEMLALQTSEGGKPGQKAIKDSQIYPVCVNIEITGGTAQQNPQGVPLQQYYTKQTPALNIPEVRQFYGAYMFPGPPMPPGLGNTPSAQLNPGINKNPNYSIAQETLYEPTDDNETIPNTHLDWFARHGVQPPPGTKIPGGSPFQPSTQNFPAQQPKFQQPPVQQPQQPTFQQPPAQQPQQPTFQQPQQPNFQQPQQPTYQQPPPGNFQQPQQGNFQQPQQGNFQQPQQGNFQQPQQQTFQQGQQQIYQQRQQAPQGYPVRQPQQAYPAQQQRTGFQPQRVAQRPQGNYQQPRPRQVERPKKKKKKWKKSSHVVVTAGKRTFAVDDGGGGPASAAKLNRREGQKENVGRERPPQQHIPNTPRCLAEELRERPPAGGPVSVFPPPQRDHATVSPPPAGCYRRPLTAPSFLIFPGRWILYFCSPNEFDSLTLINSPWYQASRSCLLYSRQLAQCGVVTAKDVEDTPENLTSLIHQFNRASRRGLFESMLRPETTEIQLIHRSLSSSAAVPGGEVFKYEFSPKGKYLLAISSSRMVVIDTATPSKELPVSIRRELKILRRPISAAILDDGSVMAVLSSEHKVNVYDLTGRRVKRVKSLDLDNAPRAIALAPDGTVLAVAYDGGVEVISLAPGFDQKRAVKCDLVDSLCFSLDGTVLIGSTLSGSPATVVISAPFFSEVMVAAESLVQMWTTQILFPTTSRDISHAALLTHHGDNSSWTFTYDKAFASFRAVRVDDLRNGHTYFSAPTTSPLPPTMLPAPSCDGGIVASGFGSTSVWIYGIPSDLENPGEGASEPSANGPSGTRNSLYIGATFAPQWQHSTERSRNNFVQGKEVGEVKGLVGLKFSMTSKGERLVAVAAGFDNEGGEEEGLDAEVLEGGRIVLFNFAKTPSIGERHIVSVDVGDGSNVELEQLEEQQNDLEAEVNIVRRRTVAQRQQRRSVIGASPVPALPTSLPSNFANDSTTSLGTSPSVSRRTTDVSRADEEDEDGVSLSEAIEWSYSHTDTRSHTILQRAATAARANAERTPRRRAGADPGPNFAVTNYRLLGLREEEWVEPPPPYVEQLTAVPLYDYEARLLERARSMGILNPNERVRRRSSGGELDVDRRERDPLASGASSPRLRRNVPSLRITSPVSPSSGGLSRNGSVSAGPSTTFQGFGQFTGSVWEAPEGHPVPPLPSSGSGSEPRRPSTAHTISRRNSIQREPAGGILSTINDTERNQTPSPQSRPSIDSQYSMSSSRSQPHQQDQTHGQRQRDPESMPQRVFFDEGSAVIPPVPIIPNQYRSNSMPMQAESPTPGLQQRAHTERPQSAMMFIPPSAPFTHPNGSIVSLPNFDMRSQSRQGMSPQQQRIPPQPGTPPAGQQRFPNPSPIRSHPSAQQQQIDRDRPLPLLPHERPETMQQQAQLTHLQQPLQQPLLSRLPSHRYRRPEERVASPALSIPSMTSASQPVTPIAPLNLPSTSSTAPVTPVTPRSNPSGASRGMMPVSAMVAQPGPPPGSSGSNHSQTSGNVGHPQFRTAIGGGTSRNTLSLTVSPTAPQPQRLPTAASATAPSASAPATQTQSNPPANRGIGTKRSKSKSKRGPAAYVNPAFMTVPQPGGQMAYPSSASNSIERPLPSPGRRVSTRRSPLHGGFYAAGSPMPSSSSVNTMGRSGSRAERSAARAASMKKKKGWGRGKGKDKGAMMMENQRVAQQAYSAGGPSAGGNVVGGPGMDESFEVVRRGSGGNEDALADKAACAIM